MPAVLAGRTLEQFLLNRERFLGDFRVLDPFFLLGYNLPSCLGPSGQPGKTANGFVDFK